MRMEAERLPRKADNMLANVHINGRHCWVFAVRRNLMMYGFGYVRKKSRCAKCNSFFFFFFFFSCWGQGWDDGIHEYDRSTVYLN